MTTEFILPDIGEGIVECELLEWLIAEGDHIEEDQPVAEVMTDKATVQIPAMHSGTVEKLHYQTGDIAKVHAPLFSMQKDEDGDSPSTSAAPAEQEQQPEAQPTSLPQGNGGSTEDFILPDIGEGIVECEIVKWHVAKGDFIEEDQPVVEVMTDKAVVEIPAKHAGEVKELYYQQGEIARVHSPLFCLSVSSADHLASAKETTIVQEQSASVSSATKASGNNTGQGKATQKWPDGEFEPPVEIPGKVLASPAVRRIAREQDIDLTAIKGSGKKGRILKQDVQSQQTAAPAALAESAEPESPTTSRIRTVPVRGVQAAMAKQMSASVQTIPHFTVSDELQMDALMSLRSALKLEFEKQDVKLSFMPFFVKALSLALHDFPIINSQLNDDATELSYFDDHNIGFAVDSKIGLLVPNIKRVQDLSLLDIARQMQEIIGKARDGKLGGDTLKGLSLIHI